MSLKYRKERREELIAEWNEKRLELGEVMHQLKFTEQYDYVGAIPQLAKMIDLSKRLRYLAIVIQSIPPEGNHDLPPKPMKPTKGNR